MTSPADVARWMADEIKTNGCLYQDEAASAIEGFFGNTFVYTNESGNTAIGRDVLSAFRRLTEATVVWDRSVRYWRNRESFDPIGRRQTE